MPAYYKQIKLYRQENQSEFLKMSTMFSVLGLLNNEPDNNMNSDTMKTREGLLNIDKKKYIS
jgi:hypothetical protein